MQTWIAENWLALYAAIVGTIALTINFSRFIHAISKDKVKFKVVAEPHKNKTENIENLADPTVRELGGQHQMLPVYNIVVRNIGNVDGYIESAAVICNDKTKKHVSIPYSNDPCRYGSIEQLGAVLVKPKSFIKMAVFLHRDELVFEAKKAEVIDSTGKKWKTKI